MSRRGPVGDGARVADILGAIERIERWTTEGPHDDRYRSAVIRELAVIGGAAAALSEEFCRRHDAIPWRAIVGLRNQVVHRYWDTSWPICAAVITDDLPVLRTTLDG